MRFLYSQKKTFAIFTNSSLAYVHHRIIRLISAEQEIHAALFEDIQIFALVQSSTRDLICDSSPIGKGTFNPSAWLSIYQKQFYSFASGHCLPSFALKSLSIVETCKNDTRYNSQCSTYDLNNYKPNSFFISTSIVPFFAYSKVSHRRILFFSMCITSLNPRI